MNGLKINGININNIRYAYDAILFVHAEKELQRLVDRAEIENGKLGLQLSVKKTQHGYDKEEGNTKM